MKDYKAFITQRQKHKTVLQLLFGIGVLIFVCLICAAYPQIYIHSQLEKLTAYLDNYPLPANSETIKAEKELRENTGNGDYCLYYVRHTVSTSLSKAAILNFYQNAEILGINEQKANRKIKVVHLDDFTYPDKIVYVIEVSDMTERYFDIGCR